MHDDRAFLDAIREQPDDDLHRLAWADWLEENGQSERSAFIRAQLRHAALGEDDPAADAFEDEADDLLANHEPAWLGPLAGLCEEWQWRRGCVERVTVWADTLLSEGERLFSLAPIREVRLLAEAQDFPRLAGCAFLSRLEGLAISAGKLEGSAITGPFHRDRALQALFVSPHLKQLRRLDLRGQGVEGQAIQTLIDTGILSRLEQLDLSANASLGDRAAGLLVGARADRLQALELFGANFTAAGVRQILAATGWPALHTLVVNCKPLFSRSGTPEVLDELLQSPVMQRNSTLTLTNLALNREAVEVLCQSPVLARLETLHLAACQLDVESATRLVESPALSNLRHLNLLGNPLRDGIARVLAAAPHLARLTQLNLAGNQVGGPGLRALLGSATLAGLRALDLSSNFVGAAGAEALAARPRRLVRLNLSAANCDAEAVRLLCASPALSRLRSLNLAANRLGDDGVQALASSPHLFRLRELSLDSNHIESPGAQALLDSPYLTRVERLSMRNAYITALEREQLRARFGAGTVF